MLGRNFFSKLIIKPFSFPVDRLMHKLHGLKLEMAKEQGQCRESVEDFLGSD